MPDPHEGELIDLESVDIDLRNPYLAAFLAWLVPGLGHCYQRRYYKALLFFLCIVPTFVAGCALASSAEIGTARNVYWSWRPADMRYWWLAQASLGIAALPAGIQAWQVNAGLPPMFGNFMAPPRRFHEDRKGIPPTIDVIRQKTPHYELATYLTVIAGLMNILVIFDALGGPFAGRRRTDKQDS